MSTLEAVDNFASGVLDIAGRLPRRAFRLVRLSFRLGLFVAGQSPRRVLDGAFGLLRRALYMFLFHLEFFLVVRRPPLNVRATPWFLGVCVLPLHVRMARKLRRHLSGSFALPGAGRRFRGSALLRK